MDNQDVFTLAKVLAQTFLIVVAYSLPALVAVCRRHDRPEVIALVNLLLGWTVVGWLVLLVCALGWTPSRSYRKTRWSTTRESFG